MSATTETLAGRTTASGLVRAFLAAMEARDLALAQSMLHPDFTMIFPGNRRYRSLDELVQASKGRYRSIGKRFERVDEAPSGADIAVYCFGTLFGEWPDGTPFQDIRFIDRFTVRGGKLFDQRVWNDMGELIAARAAG